MAHEIPRSGAIPTTGPESYEVYAALAEYHRAEVVVLLTNRWEVDSADAFVRAQLRGGA